MDMYEKELKSAAIADFRAGIISELTNPFLSHQELKRAIREKAGREYDIPYSAKRKIGVACIKSWLAKYKKYGKEALKPKVRIDIGKSRSISESDSQTIIEYLENHTDVPALTALNILKQESKVSSDISTSSLSRLLISQGFDRKNLNKSQPGDQKILHFEFFYPLECVQVDCMHAFPVKNNKGVFTKAILIAFIDDATRRIVFSEFSFTEKSIVFENGIRHILKTHGKIHKLYVDNGSTFISNQTKRILDILSIPIIHSKPGRPQGRGKVERFFRTVRDQFLRPLDKSEIHGVEDLNIRFHSWLETEYHRNPHSGLHGITPLDAWLSKTKHLISIDRSFDIDYVFLHEIKRKVYKDATFSLNGSLYEAPAIFIGKTISIFYDPVSLVKNPEIFYQGKTYGYAKLVDTYANSRIKRNNNTREIESTESTESNINKSDNNNSGSNHILISQNATKLSKDGLL